MRSIERRVHKLEDRLGVTNSQPELNLWVFKSGTQLTQAHRDICRRVLDELGFADCRVLNLGNMPYRLSVQDMERFVRENAAKICLRSPVTDTSVPRVSPSSRWKTFDLVQGYDEDDR
jgi:hypothetical protein